jgi:Protein of unknown function (DUF4239)
LLTISQNVLIVLFAMAISVGFWYVIRRYWPQERRRIHNEITGWQISVLGTTYAVIVGFMLFAAWSDFKVAEQNADGESSCVINLYWSASGLPQVQRDDIRKLAADYAEAMINVEWPAMRQGALSPAGTLTIEKLWLVVARPQSLRASEQVSLEQTTSEISSITEHRRIRQLQSQSSLPAILWAVLVMGAVITIISSCLFGSEYPVLHLLQVLALSLMLSMALVTVADVNHPFQGSVHVNPIGFENARRTFAKYGGQ